MGRLLLIFFISIAVSSHALAQTDAAQKAPESVQEQIFFYWNKVKTKVSNFFANFSKEESRKPASEPAPQEVSKSNGVTVVAQPLPSIPVAHAPTIELLDKTPFFVAPVKGTGKQEMQKVAQEVKAQPTFKVSAPARAPVTEIPMNKFGVPVFELERQVSKKTKKGKTKIETIRVVTRIPLLDVGDEAKLSANDFKMPEIEIMRVEYKNYSMLKSPEVLVNKEFEKVLGPKLIATGDPLKVSRAGDNDNIGVVTLKKVQEVAYKIAEDFNIEIKPIKEMDEEDLKFIRGLMLYVTGDKCHYATGIFFETKSAKKESLRDPSRFYLGDCLHKMGLFTQSAENLFAVLNANVPAEMKSKAYGALTEFPEDYNIELGQRFEKIMDDGITVKPDQKAKAAYMVAANAMRKENFNTARRFSEMVPEGHPSYIRAQFIQSISDYQLGKAKAGLDRLKKLQSFLPNEPVHKDLHALISLNLARMAFQEKQYAEAAKYYLAIEKNHPLWITGLTEHAWTQLMANDNEGAIGNMFSLQSTYLKAVYRPESFIVRTIGYLNLCQYADAYKSLSLLEREYRPWIPKIEAFKRNNPKPVAYYTTLIRYLTSNSTAEVGGLPYQALREIGRHKDFLNIQEAINLKIDEGEQYKFIEAVAVKDFERAKVLRSQAMTRLKNLELELKLIAAGKKIPKDENQLKMNRNNERNTIDFYDFQLSVFKEASTGFKKLKDSGKGSLHDERERLASRAGEVLRKRLEGIQKDLTKYFENNEFLRYEVFAGSGENIRFHMAGGASAGESAAAGNERRLPSTARPEKRDLNWDFEGEFWEDEIGHYKSTLKDNCPQKSQAKK